MILANLFINLGFTRDDAKWLWGQWLGGAAAIASGMFDLSYWAQYVGIPLSPVGAHIVTVLAVLSLWISGKMNYSHLPPDPAKH